MKISLTRLPFYSVLLAAFVPWINGLASSNVPGYVFNLALMCIVGIALVLSPKRQLRANWAAWLFAVAFGFAVFMLFILHRIHPLADFLVVVPVTLTYAILLRSSAVTSGELLRQLKWLYAFHISFIVFELLMFYFDSGHIFQSLSGHRYRELTFYLLRFIGTGAPNSLLLQTQAASHLVGSAFFLFYLASYGKRGLVNVATLLLLFLLFVLLITNMSLLIFVLLALAVWMIKTNLKSRISVLLILMSVTYILFDEILSIVLYRVYGGNQDLFDDYLWRFTVPISNILNAPPLQLLFGHGIDTEALESGELGFATMAFVGGVYVIVLLFVWLSRILIVGFMRYQRLKNDRDPIVAAWRSLLFLNIILCAAWAMSTAHYMIILIPGGMHLFAFSLAIVITANGRLRKLRPRRAWQELPAKQFQHPYKTLSPE